MFFNNEFEASKAIAEAVYKDKANCTACGASQDTCQSYEQAGLCGIGFPDRCLGRFTKGQQELLDATAPLQIYGGTRRTAQMHDWVGFKERGYPKGKQVMTILKNRPAGATVYLGPFFGNVPNPIMNSEQEAAANKGVCPNCLNPTLEDMTMPTMEEGKRLLCCTTLDCKHVVVLADSPTKRTAAQVYGEMEEADTKALISTLRKSEKVLQISDKENKDHCPDCGHHWIDHDFGVPSPYCP